RCRLVRRRLHVRRIGHLEDLPGALLKLKLMLNDGDTLQLDREDAELRALFDLPALRAPLPRRRIEVGDIARKDRLRGKAAPHYRHLGNWLGHQARRLQLFALVEIRLQRRTQERVTTDLAFGILIGDIDRRQRRAGEYIEEMRLMARN